MLHRRYLQFCTHWHCLCLAVGEIRPFANSSASTRSPDEQIFCSSVAGASPDKQRNPSSSSQDLNAYHRATMSHTGTLRGTPKSRSAAGQTGTFSGSPSHIPRPALETHANQVSASDAGTSTLSASRQKQSKRDEVHTYYLCKPVVNSS